MVPVRHREDDTAQHPHVHLGIDLELEVPVDHLWRPIHHRGVLFKGLELVLTPLLPRQDLVLAG